MSRNLVFRNQTVLFFAGMLALGIAALLAAMMQYQSHVMYAISIGLLPAGVLGTGLSIWILRWTAAHHPERLRAEDDERLVQIRHRAGNAAFWATYALLAGYTILSPLDWVRNIGPTAFGCGALVFMGLVNTVASLVYQRTS